MPSNAITPRNGQPLAGSYMRTKGFIKLCRVLEDFFLIGFGTALQLPAYIPHASMECVIMLWTRYNMQKYAGVHCVGLSGRNQINHRPQACMVQVWIAVHLCAFHGASTVQVGMWTFAAPKMPSTSILNQRMTMTLRIHHVTFVEPSFHLQSEMAEGRQRKSGPFQS